MTSTLTCQQISDIHIDQPVSYICHQYKMTPSVACHDKYIDKAPDTCNDTPTDAKWHATHTLTCQQECDTYIDMPTGM